MDTDTVRELFSEFGTVHIRRMFGGAGLYAGDVMFGLISDGQIFLKADAETQGAFGAENCAPFQYDTKTGKRTITSYWRLPDRLYDDTTELAQWAKLALAVAQRKAARKPARTRPG